MSTFVGPARSRRSDVGMIAAGAAREAQELGIDPREVAAALSVGTSLATPQRPRNRASGSYANGCASDFAKVPSETQPPFSLGP